MSYELFNVREAFADVHRRLRLGNKDQERWHGFESETAAVASDLVDGRMDLLNDQKDLCTKV